MLRRFVVKRDMMMGIGVADFVGWWLYYVTVTIGIVRVVKGLVYMATDLLSRMRRLAVHRSNDEKEYIGTSCLCKSSLVSSRMKLSSGMVLRPVCFLIFLVAPTLFQALSTIPYLSQISYIGLNGLFFAYYTKGDQVYALYSNSTFSSTQNDTTKYTWYMQPANIDTAGKLYGEAIKSPPSDHLVNSSWFLEALNSTHGYASLGTVWGNSSEILLLSTACMDARGVVSLGFSMKSIIDFFTTEMNFYNGSLYLATKDGNVLTQGIPNTRMILFGNQISIQLLGGSNDNQVGNITCQSDECYLRGSMLSIWGRTYVITCSPVEIAGLKLVYVLALPRNELSGLVHKNVKLAYVLIILMIGTMVMTICTFVYVILGAARREMYLCDALIKQMESTQQAERKSMNKSLAFASASHDIRASLAGITGLIEICLNNEVSKRDPLRREFQSNLLQMEACAKDLLGILNSILDTSKIEAGKMQLIEEEFDLEQLLEDVVDLYHPVGMKKGIDVILDPYNGSITKSSRVKGDRGKLKQILCNLLSNAVKFTSEGHVTVRAWSRKPTLENELIVSNGNKSMSCLLCLLSKIDESENDSFQRDLNCLEFVFEVNDTGKGIPKEKQKSVFENYVQVKETTGIGQEGTGLGLGIVQSLVRLMGGEIRIMDKEVGERGTCFRFNVFFTISEPNMSTSPNIEANNGDYISSHSPTRGQRSHMILFIQSPKRSSILLNFIEKLGIKVHIVKQHEQLIPILKKIKQKLINLSSHSSSFSGKSDIICSSSSTRSKEVPLSDLDGMDNSILLSQRKLNGPGGFVLIVIDTRAGPFEMTRKAVAEFRSELNNCCWSRVVWLDYLGTCFQGLIDPLDLLVSKPFHGSRLYQAIGLLPEYRNMTPPIRVENNVSPVEASTSDNVVKGNFYGKKEEKRLMTGKKILVADDDPIGRKIAVFVAKKLGASVFTCENGEEAWKLVCTSLIDGANAVVPFDCILMDCQMPVMDGIEATRRIRGVERNYGVHIPIIALTANERGEEEMENMIRAGVDACLTKPLNKESLFEVISELKP
ncbi:hypothetical protein RD792_017922 [Penstemon davidsonii]|uniref:histidine kinase n=1 Tax=Penstemon davidsonii TaxID=160366 RepID=A0ABR0DWM4_9LAMI|nr:hypothetical protein RD792_017922 [Penstemon davidsonii]